MLRSVAIPVTDELAGLKINEIFYSLQGEALTAGLPTVFIRLIGCPLRCVYCDTAYAFSGGVRMSLDAILQTVVEYPCKRVCVTGGEPLAQPNCIPLIRRLLKAGYDVSLETAGALSIADVPTAVSRVMDIKTPSSGEMDKNLWSNVAYLTEHDQLKFVIMNRADYDWAKQMVTEHQLADKVGVVWFSPMFHVEQDADTAEAVGVPALASQLADWILADALPVRFQLQLHKLIWADAKGK